MMIDRASFRCAFCGRPAGTGVLLPHTVVLDAARERGIALKAPESQRMHTSCAIRTQKLIDRQTKGGGDDATERTGRGQ